MKSPRRVISGIVIGVVLLVSSAFHFDGGDLWPTWVCGNHDPQHVANTTSEVEEYTNAYGCIGWDFVQVGGVTGSVLFAGEPMTGVMVAAVSRDYQFETVTLTGVEGQFEFSEIPVGEYSVEARVMGYVSEQIEVEVSPGATSEVEIQVSTSTGEDPVYDPMGLEREENRSPVDYPENEGLP